MAEDMAAPTKVHFSRDYLDRLSGVLWRTVIAQQARSSYGADVARGFEVACRTSDLRHRRAERGRLWEEAKALLLRGVGR